MPGSYGKLAVRQNVKVFKISTNYTLLGFYKEQ